MTEQESRQQQVPRIYTLQSINDAISCRDFDAKLVDAIRDGFVAYSKGQFNACPIQTMGAPPMAPFVCSRTDKNKYAAQTCVKSGYLTGESHYVIKVASGGRPMPNSGLMQVYSQTTGRLEALLLDDGILTELRTAAVGAVAAMYLAPSRIHQIGMLGSGVQSRYQLRYLQLVTDCRRVLVWGRTSAHVKSFQHDMTAQGWTVELAQDADELLETCELIVTTTSAREPVLLGNSVVSQNKKKAQHITCIGADATGKMELHPDLVGKADLLVADSRVQTQERGEFEEAIGSGMASVENVVELGELQERTHLQRKRGTDAEEDERLTIFDSSGVAVQDCVVAKMVYDTLLAQETSK